MSNYCINCKWSDGKTKTFMVCLNPKAQRVCPVMGETLKPQVCEILRAPADQLTEVGANHCGPVGINFEPKHA